MELREYQEQAVTAALGAYQRGVLRSLVVLPTGAGKSLVAGEIARRVASVGGRIIIVTHVKELVEQDAAACRAVGLDVGIYSAGLGLKECDHDVIVAGIQSAFRCANFGRRDVLLIDEAHRVRSEGDGQYHALINQLRKDRESLAVIGLTATPYRTGSGYLTDGDPPLFDEIVYTAEIPDLISQGFLSKLRSKQADSPDLKGVRTIAGDWSEDGLAEVMTGNLSANCEDLVRRAKDRTRTLIFGCTISHCEAISEELKKHGWTAPIITGSTPDAEREYLTRAIKGGEIRALINCQVLTTGFDAPGIDCVALMRPTKSPGLYYQMVGRGFRIAQGKEDCLICDYGGNIVRHGPLDHLVIGKSGTQKAKLMPTKICPECQEVLPLAARECACGWVAPPIEAKTAPTVASASILGAPEPVELEISDWSARVHSGVKSGRNTLRVEYRSGFRFVSEYICLEHEGYPLLKAQEWWLRHGGKNIPATCADAERRLAELRRPATIHVIRDGRFDRVVRRSFANA